MKTLNIPKISYFLLTFLLFSCNENKKSKIISIFSNIKGTQWNCFPIDSSHSFYAYRVKEFFPDGTMYEYINSKSEKKLRKMPKDNNWNPEKWFIINDSTISVESVYNPKTKSYYTYKRKLLYHSKDTIILQGTKENNYSGILILTRRH